MPTKATAPKTRKTAPKGLPAAFLQEIKNAHNSREDAMLDEVANMVRQTPSAINASLLVHLVVKAAVDVLFFEHINAHPGAGRDLVRAREHFTKALMKGCEVLGSKFDALYTAKIAEHNAAARVSLDQSKGTTRSITAYVLPVFEADGTHPPIGPKDFPWAQVL